MPSAPRTHRQAPSKAVKHNPRGKNATSRQQRRAMHTGSKGWKLQRQRVLLRDNFTCRKCGHYGDQVDHTTGNAHEIVGDDELQTLCHPCHSAKTMREQNAQANARRP